MEEKKSPASAAESAASGQPAAVPAAELRPGRRKFPTVGDLFAMLGIAFGAQIVVGTAAMVFLLFAGHGLDFKSLEPAALGKVMAALYFCSMSITLAGILYYRRARGGSGPWARFSARGLNPALLLWAFVQPLSIRLHFHTFYMKLLMNFYRFFARNNYINIFVFKLSKKNSKKLFTFFSKHDMMILC